MKTLLLITSFFFCYGLFSQNRMILFLKDKPSQEIIHLSDRAKERRERLGIESNENDIPIDRIYVRELKQKGQVLNESRWLNAVCYSTELSANQVKKKFPFVTRIQTIGHVNKPERQYKGEFYTTKLNYGPAVEQTTQIHVDCMHALGYTGSGVYLGIIDAGFINFDSIPMFDSVYSQNRLLDEYNFVNSDSSVFIWSGHGTAVASCIVGYTPQGANQFAGTAIDVDLALYIAEDVFSETEAEEFNVVAALERCDSVGVDVVNISLGYFNFDDSLTSHVYADMDGQTTIAAMGVNVAASKGIAVVCSAGNGGPGKISTPCDADSALCIGAVDSAGVYAFFSSVGPSFDGQVKPDVAARGYNAWVVITNGAIVQGSGTSFSSPITAGAVACLRQANPSSSVDQLFNAIRQSATQFSTPDTLLGYGIPDFCQAHGIINNSIGIGEIPTTMLGIYPIPANKSITVNYQIAENSNNEFVIMNAIGEKVRQLDLKDQSGSFEIDVESLSNGLYFVKLGDKSVKLMINH